MVARLLLGIVAALRAVLITGQAELLSSHPLTWPRFNFPHRPAATPGDRDRAAVKAPAT